MHLILLAWASTALMAGPAWAGEVGRPLPRPVPGAPPPACRYTVTVLQGGLMCGGSPQSGQARAITQDGIVAGERYCSATSRQPFLWSPTGGYQALAGPPDAFDASVDGMNEHREIVGTAQYSIFPTRGYLRKANGQYQVLGFPISGTTSSAFDVGPSSLVVGNWGNQLVGPNPVPCTWQDGVMTDLSATLAQPLGEARAINERGQITGWTGSSPFVDARAFILDGGSVSILPPIPGGIASEGWALNANGDVVGKGRFTASTWHAYMYADGQAFDLGALPGSTKCSAAGINIHKVVVGGSSSRAFVWQNGVMRDLNALIPTQPQLHLNAATAINDAGQIVLWGAAGSISGPSRAVLLTPVYSSPADLNGDCQVNGFDLAVLLGAWGPVKPIADASADINGDGIVNGIDLAMLLGEWG